MRRAVHRFRSLPLRSRLALLVAAAVAFAVAAVSVTCWFIVQGKLYEQVDDRLDSVKLQLSEDEIVALLAACPKDGGQTSDYQEPRFYYLQVVTSDGKACVFPSSLRAVKVTGRDRDVAADPQAPIHHNATDTAGEDIRVRTSPILVGGSGVTSYLYRDVALMVGVSLKDTQKTLNDLALILLLVSGVGVVGAGAAGLAVARAGLRPVDKLTEAVEHVARTEDLSIRIPTEGDDEIARLSESFNSMTSALASSRDLQQQLIADAGHELRTPLTSLRTNIELLTRSEETGRAIPPADRKALLASVKAQMTELASLIGDLQELSRSDSGQHGKGTPIVDFQETVENALRRARLRGPELTITASLEPWYVRGEPAALERAVVNILDNAVKFSPRGGTIEVAMANGRLTVRDHGPGIPTDELPYVFDRFWRSPSARALPGSGLGLSIVARTVRQSGGDVSLNRAEGGGTVASIRLPGAPTRPPDMP